MNRLLNFFNKFEVSPFATIFILLTLLTNSYKLFFIYFLITFIHELGHVIMALILNLKIEKIKLMSIGFNAEIENLDYTSSIKEFLVAIAGPLTFFVSKYLLIFLYKIDFISYNAFVQANIVNEYNFIFNLLPILPLDGGRILKIVIDNFLTSKKAMIFASIFSICFTLIFIVYTIRAPQWLVYIFLIITNISGLMAINRKWKSFLLSRLTLDNKYRIKIHSKQDIYRNKNNYIIFKKTILDEKRAIEGFIKNYRT